MTPIRRHDETIAEVIHARRDRLALLEGYRDLLVRVALLAAALWLLLSQVFLVAQASGNGMFPAVKDGDLVIAFRLQSDYAKGDLVVCQADGKRQIGRIAAQGGDQVFLDEGGALFVNGALQTGEILYPTYPAEPGSTQLTVPEDSIYILGDHRTQCEDSRHFGAVPMADVEGKIITLLRRRGL